MNPFDSSSSAGLHTRAVLHLHAVLMGLGVGYVLVLALALSDALLDPPEAIGVWVLKALAVYAPAGFVAGAQAWRGRPAAAMEERVKEIPAGLHGLLAGALLALAHGLTRYFLAGEVVPGVEWVAAEALLVAALSTMAGAAGGRYQRRKQDENNQEVSR